MIARANRKMKEEMRKNNFKEEPTYYIDRDRAAATVAGSKDIKSELKVNCILYILIYRHNAKNGKY